MNIKKYSSFLLILFAMLFVADDANAQRRGTKKRKSRESEEVKDQRLSRTQSDFREKLTYEIGFGNPTFFGGGGQSQFNIALKPGVGYKLVDRVATGIFIKGDYTFANLGGQEFSLLDYGAGVFAKFKIVDAVYVRAEGTYQNYSYDRSLGITNRAGFLEPLLGAGYRSGFGDWVFGAEILFHMDRDVRTYAGQVYEFWLKIDYKF